MLVTLFSVPKLKIRTPQFFETIFLNFLRLHKPEYMDQKLKAVLYGCLQKVATHSIKPTTRRFALEKTSLSDPSAVLKLIYLNLDMFLAKGCGLHWFSTERQNSIVLNFQGVDTLHPESVILQFSRQGAEVVDLKCGGGLVEILYRATGTDALGLTVTVCDQIVSASIAKETVSLVFPASAVLSGSVVGREVDVMFGEWLPGKRFRLLFRSSRDGATAASFHCLCDGQGPTVTLIKSSGGYVFGGYAGVAWSSDDTYYACPSAFLFTVTNPHGDPITRFMSNGDGAAVLCYSGEGPSFGTEDLRVDGAFDGGSYTCLPASYTDTRGRGTATFTGDLHFTPAEVEVWAVE
jgi:hypothetical protein